MRKDVIACLKEGLDMLTPRHRMVVELRYIERRTYKEIAIAMHESEKNRNWGPIRSKPLSLERIRQILATATRRLRKHQAPKLRKIID